MKHHGKPLCRKCGKPWCAGGCDSSFRVARREYKEASREPQKLLHWRQAKILLFIRGFIAEKQYPPVIKEIQQECNISSPSVVHYHLVVLEAKDLITRGSSRQSSRTIVVTELGWTYEDEYQ